MRTKTRCFLFVMLLSVIIPACAMAEGNFPGADWEYMNDPAEAGWSSEDLAHVQEYADSMDMVGGLVSYDGKILCQWGDITKSEYVASVRKSLLSSLYGIYVAEGKIDLNATMADLGIDDNAPSLTDEEKQARVIDLLKARSGIYHNASYETEAMKGKRPERGSHAPDTFWYYNNWDFNVLGAIFEKLTGTKIGDAFKERIATPTGMQDFEAADVQYVLSDDSIYPAYPFRMSARDLARFGLLYLRNGEWNGEQVVPSQWIVDSITPYSVAGNKVGYGYLWWIGEGYILGNKYKGTVYRAEGKGGHFIIVLPELNIVIVTVSDYNETRLERDDEMRGFVKLVLKAAVK